jgi:hypothetical protein
MHTEDLDFEAAVEDELQRRVGSLEGPSPRVSQAAFRAARAHTGRSFSWLRPSRAAAALGIAALSVGGASVAAAAATGSSDPAVWGKTVTAAVSTCRGELKDGAQGIGRCVSQVAREKGDEVKAAREAGGAGRGHGKPSRDEPSPSSSPEPRGEVTAPSAAPHRSNPGPPAHAAKLHGQAAN